MLAGSGGRLRNSARNCRGSALGNDYPVGARSVGRAQDCAEIMRIFHSVKNEKERILAPPGSDHVGKVVVLLGGGDCDHPLVGSVSGHAVEFSALQEAHGYAEATAIFDEPLQANIVTLFSHANPFEGASPGLQSFA